MNCRIEAREAFTLVGMERSFSMAEGSALRDIPLFWDEFFDKGHGETINPELGVCMEESPESQTFRYLIAQRSSPDAPVPEGFTKETIPALTWAVFEGKGALPHALQSLNRRIYEEWLPTNGAYSMGAGYAVEYYACGDMASDDYAFEIWLPVKKIG